MRAADPLLRTRSCNHLFKDFETDGSRARDDGRVVIAVDVLHPACMCMCECVCMCMFMCMCMCMCMHVPSICMRMLTQQRNACA
jgi:hypothetical protein